MKTVYIDITNIPELRHYTGISRVTSEIILRLISNGVNVVLLAWSNQDNAYRIVDNERFILIVKGILTNKKLCYTDRLLQIDDFEKGSVFFEVNSCWHTMPNRSYLLPRLKNNQVRIIVLIHDIIPIRFPQYMIGQTLMRFMEFLMAHMTYADDIVVTTNFVESDVKQLFRELGLKEKPIHKIPLGADFSFGDDKASSNETVDTSIVQKLSDKKFILSVGTIEPRKNHKVIVDAYETKLAKLGVDVVLVGNVGWEMEGLIDRIKSNNKFDNGIYIFSGINDATLNYLYQSAYMVVFPSYIEGFGLPTIEALISGIPVACSDIPVMREVGGEYCDYFHPDDPSALISIVEKYVQNPALYTQKREQLANDYIPPTWKLTADRLYKLICSDREENKFVHKPIKQIVFLSARPAPILATLPYIENFMPFIKELVVCCPDYMAGYMQENYRGRLKLTTVTDDELLNGRKLPPDHSTRNFFLRCLAMELDQIDDEFIMCDDDYRPLQPLTEEVFYKDGKYRGYYFSDISQWHYLVPKFFSYDYCHFRTLKFLKNNGYPTYQYSSHQPQVINKVWYRELLEKYPEIKRKGYDEWSTYFNYCAVEHCDSYEAMPYVTLSWPNIGGETKGVFQKEYLFENFYEDNYNIGRPFNGLTKSFFDEETTLKDNERKKLLAFKYKMNHQDAEKMRSSFEREYEEEYNEVPGFSVYFHEESNKAPDFGCPCRYTLSRRLLNKIKIGISRAERCSVNLHQAVVEMKLVDGRGRVYFTKKVTISPRLNYTYMTFMVPRSVPRDGRPMFMRVIAKSVVSNARADVKIPVEYID